MTLNLTSTAFSHNGELPARYTCDDADVSPPLAWSGLPDGTRSLVLIVDDPDAPDPAAPRITWVHWVLYNIPPASTVLPEGAASRDLPKGTHEGLNDWKRTGYGGPCPPDRPAPQLPQALRPGHGPSGHAQPHQSSAGKGYARTHPCSDGTDRDLSAGEVRGEFEVVFLDDL
jgi:Raf kinase inhibitor-like YbhB/YbcL family protein